MGHMASDGVPYIHDEPLYYVDAHACIFLAQDREL